MNKKAISMALAICMVFGSASALPKSGFVNTSGITASADTYYETNDYKCRVMNNGNVEITWYKNQNAVTSLTIPATIAGRKVERIGEEAFYEKKIGTITVPEGVTYLGDKAFNGCTAKTIYLPSTTPQTRPTQQLTAACSTRQRQISSSVPQEKRKPLFRMA